MDISKLRKKYEEEGIDSANALGDPMEQFKIWYAQAKEAIIFATKVPAGLLHLPEF